MLGTSSDSRPVRVLFLIENMSYRYDSRVRRQTATLQQMGVEIAVVCPASSRNDIHHYVENDIDIYQYEVDTGDAGIMGHFREYLVSLFWQSILTAKIFFRRGFDVIHVGNPPDILWLVALPYKVLGKRFIYDHHDQVPELFEVRFGKSRTLLRRIVSALEGISFRLANHTISINETCRQIAIERGRRPVDEVTVVRNGPRLSDFPQVTPSRSVRELGEIVVGFLGEVNPQDNLEVFIEMARIVRSEFGRGDIGFLIIGTGTAWSSVKALRDAYELKQAVSMPGRIPWKDVLSSLCAVDICVQPDLPNQYTNIATMNKLMEYMALGKAVVSFDLVETRVSGGDAIAYAPLPTPGSLAETIMRLADDPAQRKALAHAGRMRVEKQLAWEHQANALISVYEKLFPGRLKHRFTE